MNVVVVIFLVVSVVVVTHQQSANEVRNEWRKAVAPHINQCLCESRANLDHVEGFFEFGEIINDPCFKCKVKCLLQATGIMSTTGNINTTIYRSFFGITDEIVSKCGYNTHDDLCQRAFEMLVCNYSMIVAREAGNSKNIISQTSVFSQMFSPNALIRPWNALPQFILQSPKLWKKVAEK